MDKIARQTELRAHYGRLIGVRYANSIKNCDQCNVDLTKSALYVVVYRRIPPKEYRTVHLMCKKCRLLNVSMEEFHIILMQ